MSVNVVNLINPTKKDFTYPYNGEEVTIPAGKTVALPEACALDLAYHLAQRILEAKNIPFFGEEHSECQAELMGLKEPTYFTAKVLKVEEIKTKSGKINKIDVDLEPKDLIEVPETPEPVIPERNVRPLAANRDEGITLD
jgi:hypothetical protein